ncbi:MAG: transthyretin-like family protein [bacterium]|nr:transthyretin-like family protein [bacterium]
MFYKEIGLQKVAFYFAIALFVLLLLPGIAKAKSITLSGRLYYGPSNDRIPIRYARVEVWDDWGLTPLAYTQTDSEGRFTIRYENSAVGDGLDNLIDPYLKVICNNDGVHVQGPAVFQLIIPGPLNLIPGLIDWGFKTEVIETGLDKEMSFQEF